MAPLFEPSPFSRSDVDKLRRGYVVQVLSVGSFYTLGNLRHEMKAFSVLKMFSGREKLVDVGSAEDRRDMMAIQMYEIWSPSTGDADVSVSPLSVYALNEPIHVVPWHLSTSFDEFRIGLQSWACGPSDVAGCLELAAPSTAESRLASIVEEELPILILLERLEGRGWKPVQKLTIHTRSSKQFCTKNIFQRHAYFQVLMKWGDLKIEKMRSDQTAAYYTCILNGHAAQ